jgi:hypothetical protein
MTCDADKDSSADVNTLGQGDMRLADHAGTQITRPEVAAVNTDVTKILQCQSAATTHHQTIKDDQIYYSPAA